MRKTVSSRGSFEVEVLVHGRPAQEYSRDGETFMEGRRGSEFTLRVRNSSSRKALAAVSVDGLSVMDGQEATRGGAGYVIESYGSVDIPGWRLDNTEVAHFVFSDLPEAYASRMGKPRNIGVIGVSIFHEKHRIPHEIHRKSFGPTLGDGPGLFRGGVGSERPVDYGDGIGTGFGRRTKDEVTSVHFNREDLPVAELLIRYDDAKGLRHRGIDITTPHGVGDRVVSADPFPGDVGCKPPADWHGD